MTGVHVTLRKITRANRAEVENVRVSAEQQAYVDGVRQSLDEAAANPATNPWYRAIYVGGTPVGFLMIGDNVPPGDEHIPWRYYLWRMLIDDRYQGRGYGRAALDRLTEYLRTRPGADTLVTSIVPGAHSPLGFYVRYGFQPTGEWFDHEQVLRLSLAAPPSR